MRPPRPQNHSKWRPRGTQKWRNSATWRKIEMWWKPQYLPWFRDTWAPTLATNSQPDATKKSMRFEGPLRHQHLPKSWEKMLRSDPKMRPSGYTLEIGIPRNMHFCRDRMASQELSEIRISREWHFCRHRTPTFQTCLSKGTGSAFQFSKSYKQM